MDPYYEEDGITIYHGDTLEIMSTLDFDLIVTDPPYGINLDTDYSSLKGSGRFAAGVDGKAHLKVHGDDEPFNPAPFLNTGPCLMFGANHYAASVPPGATWHVWDKRDGLASNMLADAELWFTTWMSGPTRVYRHKWLGYMRKSDGNKDGYLHPTQKPLGLMLYVLGEKRTPPGVILDPFMGSGTTLRAAKDLGRRAIGIEIEEKYCEIAAKRLGQGVLPW